MDALNVILTVKLLSSISPSLIYINLKAVCCIQANFVYLNLHKNTVFVH